LSLEDWAVEKAADPVGAPDCSDHEVILRFETDHFCLVAPWAPSFFAAPLESVAIGTLAKLDSFYHKLEQPKFEASCYL